MRTISRTTSIFAAIAMAGLTQASPAQAAVAGSAEYICATPVGDVTVPVSVVSEQIPTSAPAGFDVPSGLIPVEVDLSIPASLGDTLLSLGVTAVGGAAPNFTMNLGPVALPLLDVSTEPVVVVAGQPTLLPTNALTGAFTTPAAGQHSINLPDTFSFVATRQDGSPLATLNCSLTEGTPSAVGEMSLAKQVSTTTASTKSTKPTKRPIIDVAVARQVGGTPAGTVVAKIGSKTVGKGELAGGTARLALSQLKPGKYNVTVKYAGDDATQPSATKVPVTVIK